jgi:arabinan endo-1,5-alpha-L-arabinosidase
VVTIVCCVTACSGALDTGATRVESAPDARFPAGDGAVGRPRADARGSDGVDGADAAPPSDAGRARIADGERSEPPVDGALPPPDGSTPDAAPPDGPGPPTSPCETVVQYGDAWIRPDGRVGDTDVAPGLVTWDGVCTPDEAGNAFATLSNGWRPFFRGRNACRMALDPRGDCAGGSPACTTRIAYGDTWEAPEGHAARFDDAAGRVFPAGACGDAGGGVRRQPLSNGWVPHFRDECRMAFRWSGCGGLYANPVVAVDCPDPGVLRVDDGYVMTCTSGNAGAAFPLFTSPDLVQWRPVGHVFPAGTRPAWGTGDFWAPEIHRIGDHYVAYYSARHGSGQLALGAARADSPLGPFVDLGAPLLLDPGMGMIDASAFVAADGRPYLTWKHDGNAVGRRTPIVVQPLAPDGLSLVEAPVEAFANDRRWEGALVEGPFIVAREGSYYLFYSANAFFDARYALGVARAPGPLGPWEKRGDPLLVSGGAFAGPGHGSVVEAPGGEDALVYHAWAADAIGGGPGRMVLLDAVRWADGWPSFPGAPSADARPKP